VIIFDKKSWHYRLVIYVFTSEFFLEDDGFDTKAMESIDMEKDFRVIYKKKSKTVNLCPYCRGVVGAIVSLPFVWLYRKFPHKEKKPLTHQQIMKNIHRRGIYIRYVAGSVNLGLGISLILNDQAHITAAIQIGLGLLLTVLFPFSVKIFTYLVPVLRITIKFLQSLLPKKEQTKSEKIKNPSLIMTKLNAEHDKICPPIYFVNTSKPEDHK